MNWMKGCDMSEWMNEWMSERVENDKIYIFGVVEWIKWMKRKEKNPIDTNEKLPNKNDWMNELEIE